MPTSSTGRKPTKRRRSSTAVTAKASSAALRRLIADQFGGNFGGLATAIRKGDTSLRARIMRVQAEKRPSELSPELAQEIVRVVRPKSAMAKRALKLVRKIAKAAAAEPQKPKRSNTQSQMVELLTQSPLIEVLVDGNRVVSSVVTPNLVRRNGSEYALCIPIDAQTALGLLLPE